MTLTYPFHLIAAVPARAAPEVNALLDGMGEGPGNFGVPLATRGSPDTVTHRGLRTVVTAAFFGRLSDWLAGRNPPEGVSSGELLAVMASTLIHMPGGTPLLRASAEDTGGAAWAEFLKRHDLEPYREEDL